MVTITLADIELKALRCGSFRRFSDLALWPSRDVYELMVNRASDVIAGSLMAEAYVYRHSRPRFCQ
jgi:hypothetical protein